MSKYDTKIVPNSQQEKTDDTKSQKLPFVCQDIFPKTCYALRSVIIFPCYQLKMENKFLSSKQKVNELPETLVK